ncbi:MAG: KH domain-containing protein [Epsilonproteobacteria bacterium]|nr:KH domain-containing protein [Campylobacterota bacterium]
MVKDFILNYAKLIATYPDVIKVEIVDNISEDYSDIIVYAKPIDVGKLIGKKGKMINAIKAVISGCKAKGEKNYKITVQSIDNE